MQMSSTDNKMVGASIEVNGGTFIAEYWRILDNVTTFIRILAIKAIRIENSIWPLHIT